MRVSLFLALLAASSAATAAQRGYSVQDFDRIRVEGPYDVNVRVGSAATARAMGPQEGLDRLTVSVNDGMLVIKPDRGGWGGWPGAKKDEKVVVTITTRALNSVTLTGSGDITVDRMRGPNLALGIAGSGDISVGVVQAETIALSVAGSGDITVAGGARQARANLQGSGDVDASGLRVQDAVVAVAGSGDLKLAASRTAKITTAGSGDVEVVGTASCTVSRAGSGDVTCGKGG